MFVVFSGGKKKSVDLDHILSLWMSNFILISSQIFHIVTYDLLNLVLILQTSFMIKLGGFDWIAI